MEKVIAVLCIIALSVTAGHGYYDLTGQEPPGFTDDGDDDSQLSDIKTVTVPAQKLRDIVHYDHTSLVELYWENTSSGEYEYYRIDIQGEELIKIPSTSNKPDGFGAMHSVAYVRRELLGTVELLLESSDDEPFSAGGDYNAQRDEYLDLLHERLTLLETNANISVEELPRTTMPLAFQGELRNYFDPWEPKLETLDDSIYKNGQTINVGDSDQWVDKSSPEEYTYEWVAERGEVIAGYDTVLINATTDLDLGFLNISMPFLEQLYLANEVPVPVKQYIRTNTTLEWEDIYSFTNIENLFQLQEGGFREGDQAIPWGSCNGEHWRSTHPEADLDSWNGNYMPVSGSSTDWDQSSFNSKPEEIVDWILTKKPSDDLKEFLFDYPDAVIMNSDHNESLDSTDTDGKAGTFWWNFTFGHKLAPGETRWGKEYRYPICIKHERTWEPVPPLDKEYTDTYTIDWENGAYYGSSQLSSDDIDSQTMTLASSEKVLKTDSKVLEYFYTTTIGLPADELDWGDGSDEQVRYRLQSLSGYEPASIDLIATLTGIQIATEGKYYWQLEQDNLYSIGRYKGASLDAETGRIISVTKIEGDSLEGALNLGGGD